MAHEEPQLTYPIVNGKVMVQLGDVRLTPEQARAVAAEIMTGGALELAEQDCAKKQAQLERSLGKQPG